MNILMLFSLLLVPVHHSLIISELVVDPPTGTLEWIEFYNEAESDLSLTGYSFRDSQKSNVQKFPGVQIFPRKSYRVVYPSQDLTNPFGLGSSDEVNLYDSSGVKIHSTSWVDGDVPLGYSWAYCNGVFRATSTVTKSDVNICNQQVLICPQNGTVEISEIKTKNFTGTMTDYDWIEVWNPSSSQVADLSCWTISDSSTGYISRFKVPFGTLVQPKSYEVIILDNTIALGKSDEVHLFNGQDLYNEVEKVAWNGKANSEQTLSRCTSPLDASIQWEATTMTKKAQNFCADPSTVASIVINEVSATGNGTEWVEFYNEGTISIDTTLWRFSDAWRGGGRLPAEQQEIGAPISPGEYLVVAVGNKFSFSGGSPDSCRLYSPVGALVDFTSWTDRDLPGLGTTWARCSNGKFNVTKIPTKSEANICSHLSNGLISTIPSIFSISSLWIVILSLNI